MRRFFIAGFLSLIFIAIFFVGAFAQTKEFLVSKQVDGFNWSPEVAVDEDGNALVVWVWLTDDYSQYEIYAAYLEKKGKKYKAETPIKISGKKIYNQYPTVAYQKLSKTFLVVWEADKDNIKSLQYLEFDDSGTPIGSEKELIGEMYNHFNRPLLCAFDNPRKEKKSYLLAYYRIGAESKDTGLWTAILSSSGKVTKGPKHVLPVTIHGVGLELCEPTSLKSMPGGKGFLLGTYRIERIENPPIRRGFVLRLNKAGKAKKTTSLEDVENATIVSCDALTKDDFFTSYYLVDEGRVYNRMLDSSLRTISETYNPDNQNCNAYCVVKLEERIFQLFAVNYPGFRIVEIGNDGHPLGSPAFVETDKTVSPDFVAVPLPDSKRILILTTVRNSSSPIDSDIYAITYNVPE